MKRVSTLNAIEPTLTATFNNSPQISLRGMDGARQLLTMDTTSTTTNSTKGGDDVIIFQPMSIHLVYSTAHLPCGGLCKAVLEQSGAFEHQHSLQQQQQQH